jgi:hypothetical protein
MQHFPLPILIGDRKMLGEVQRQIFPSILDFFDSFGEFGGRLMSICFDVNVE